MALALLIRYWREVTVGILILAVAAAGVYARAVLAERNELRREKARLEEQVKSAAALQELTNKIAGAISSIRVRSQVNVSRIETEPKPRFIDARPLPFIPGGMLQAVYSSAAAARAASGPAPGEPLPAGDPPGGVLPR